MTTQRYKIAVHWAGPGWYGERYVTNYTGEWTTWDFLHNNKSDEPDRLDDERYTNRTAIEWLETAPTWADLVLRSEGQYGQ